MNNITYKKAFINTNDLYINSFYNRVLAKIISFVMSSISTHLCIVRSLNSQNCNKNVTAVSFPLNATTFISFYSMYIIFTEVEIILRYLHLKYFIF